MIDTSLESKAKTLAEIASERKKWQDAFTQGALGNQQAYAYARDNRPLYEQQTKWVPLEEANFKIAEKQVHIDLLLAKIAEALKVIETFKNHVDDKVYPNDGSIWTTFGKNVGNLLNELEQILSEGKQK